MLGVFCVQLRPPKNCLTFPKSNAFLSVSNKLLQDAYIIFQHNVDTFERAKHAKSRFEEGIPLKEIMSPINLYVTLDLKVSRYMIWALSINMIVELIIYAVFILSYRSLCCLSDSDIL